MSDTSPKNQDALLAGHQRPSTPAEPKPRERHFDFVRERDRVHFRCDLLDHGVIGVEAQIFRDGEFSYSLRLPTRAVALAWATDERRAIEAYRREDVI